MRRLHSRARRGGWFGSCCSRLAGGASSPLVVRVWSGLLGYACGRHRQPHLQARGRRHRDYSRPQPFHRPSGHSQPQPGNSQGTARVLCRHHTSEARCGCGPCVQRRLAGPSKALRPCARLCLVSFSLAASRSACPAFRTRWAAIGLCRGGLCAGPLLSVATMWRLSVCSLSLSGFAVAVGVEAGPSFIK